MKLFLTFNSLVKEHEGPIISTYTVSKIASDNLKYGYFLHNLSQWNLMTIAAVIAVAAGFFQGSNYSI